MSDFRVGVQAQGLHDRGAFQARQHGNQRTQVALVCALKRADVLDAEVAIDN